MCNGEFIYKLSFAALQSFLPHLMNFRRLNSYPNLFSIIFLVNDVRGFDVQQNLSSPFSLVPHTSGGDSLKKSETRV